MSDWNSKQYLKFEKQRTQPSIDLANRIAVESPRRLIDIGCGPGNSTKALANRFPGCEVLGIDSSPSMIETAREKYPEFSFQLCDASSELSGLPGNYDIVFSNACIQWIPDHEPLLHNMFALLAPGGVMAVQLPINQQEPVHRAIRSLAASPEWKAYFPNPRSPYSLAPGEYYDILADLTDDFDIWQITYFHTMKSHYDIIEWFRGTGLRPYLDALPSDKERAVLEQELLDELVKAYPVQKNGDIILRFPRLFFTAKAD